MGPRDSKLPRNQDGRVFASHHKMLVVEDESLVAWNLEEMLRASGVGQVFMCASLAAARQVLAEHADISLVILDLKLHDGNGGELLDEILARNLPVIVTTGYSHFDRTGIPILIKPYSFETLLGAAFGVLGLEPPSKP